MKHIGSYFIVCCKRAAKCFIPILIMTLVIVAALVLVGSILLSAQPDEAISKARVKVGVVGDVSQTYLGKGFETIKELDSVSLSLDFVETDLETAQNALKNSQMSAYIVVPENYVEDMASGKDVKLEFVMPETSAAASSILVSEVVKILSPLVTESQRGIYAIGDFRRANNIKYQKNVSEIIQLSFFSIILDREHTIALENLEKSSMSVEAYYVCGIAIFFLMLFSTACCVLFSDKKLPLGRLLCSKNLKSWHLVLCEYATYTLIVTVTALIICIVGEIGLGAMNINIPEFSSGMMFKSLIILLPCILMITSIQFFIYESSGNIITGVLAQFLFSCGCGYISGCFYPYYFFPQSIQNFSSKLPSGIAFEHLRNFVMGEDSASVLPVCALYIGISLMLSILIRRFRLRRETT